MDALRALFEPATQTVTTKNLPPVRKSICQKCPFGNNLTPSEQSQADALKLRLSNEANKLWGCHETVNAGKPQICAGFASWKAAQ